MARSLTLGMLLLGQLFPAVLDVSPAAVALVLVIPLVIASVLRELPVVHIALLFVVVVFAPFFVYGQLHPPTTAYGQDKYLHLVTVTALSALSVVVLRDRRDVRVFAMTWAALGCTLAFAAMLGTTDRGRAVGFGNNPIWLARSMGSAVIATIWLHRQKLLRTRVALPAAALLVSAVLATGSRGPLMATVAATTLILAWGSGRRLVRITAVGATGALAYLATQYLSVLEGSRIAGLLADPVAAVSDRTREELLHRTYPVIAQNSGGVGYGNWRYAAGMLRFKYPHDLWAEVLAEEGWLVGGLLVTVTGAVLVRLLWRARTDHYASLALGLLTFESIAVSVSGDVNARTFFAVLTLGFLIAVGRPGPGDGDDAHHTADGRRVANGRRVADGRRPADGRRVAGAREPGVIAIPERVASGHGGKNGSAG